MKIILFISIVLLSFTYQLSSQSVTGKLGDEFGAALAEVQLQLFTPSNVYNATSNSDGTFSFNLVTEVEENQLPTGYSVSDNFPNPFNPRTRISITLPIRGNVKVEVFNLLGQTVADLIEETFDAGSNYIDIELNGLPNGFYISRITIDEKYTIVKKLMLIYGSQHLSTSGGKITSPLNKSDNIYLVTNLDSLVATSAIIGRKTFSDLPSFVDGTLDLGNLTVERYCDGIPTVLYNGKIYNTVTIGSQCWLRENLDVGTRIDGTQTAGDNSVIEKYCYNDDPSNCSTYGGLYQWSEAMQYSTVPGVQGICPPDFHIPTLAEFQTLKSIISGDGNSLKAIGQGIDGGAGTNISGFSALLAGTRGTSGLFNNLENVLIFWTSTESDAIYDEVISLNSSSNIVALYRGYKDSGFSVRCIKD